MSAASWNDLDVMRTASQRVLLSAWQANRNRGSSWFLALMGLLLVGVPVWVWWSAPQGQTLQVTLFTAVVSTIASAVSVAAVGLVVAWAKLVFNVLLQNHPQTARLLPGQVPVLRNTLCATAALLCALATLPSWLAGGPVLTTVAGTALGLASLALCVRWVWLWSGLVVFGFSLPFLSPGGYLEPVLSVWHAAPGVFTLLALVLATLALRAVVMTGDARHVRAHARLQNMSATMRGQGPTSRVQGGSRWMRDLLWGESAYAAWMSHVLVRSQQSLGRRLALGLGPRAHWTSLLAVQLIVLLVVPLLAVLTDFRGVGQAMGNGALIVITMIGLIAVTQQLPIALWASRREQALLCLLPGVPQGAGLNRWLARLLVTTAVGPLALLALALLILGPVAHTDTFGGKNGDMALSLLVLDAPWVFLLWRNWARAQAPVGGAPGLLLLAMFLAFGLAYAWVYWLGRSWYELTALTLLLMLPLGWWRWRVISRAPTAWPVGRLG